MKQEIEQALAKSYTYDGYKQLVTNLLLDGKSTGHIQSEDLTHYSQLNETRMKRLDKTIVITEAVAAQLKSIKQNYLFLVISEGWCGDAAQILPIINKMVNLAPTIDLKIVLRDDNESLMNLFLTNNAKSIP
ncbi:MAG: thioredoxin family protein, partial [Flavobacterium sp.]